MSEGTNLKTLLSKNFDNILKDYELFVSQIPHLARLIGIVNFQSKMALSKTQYYRRVKNPDAWTLDELEKAKCLFQEFKLGDN